MISPCLFCICTVVDGVCVALFTKYVPRFRDTRGPDNFLWLKKIEVQCQSGEKVTVKCVLIELYCITVRGHVALATSGNFSLYICVNK